MAFLIAVGAATACPAADIPEKADPPLPAQVAKLLRGLDSDDFRARDAATASLEALPGEALPLIEDALATGTLSPEVSMRLEAKVGLLRRRAAATAYEKAIWRDLQWNRDTSLAAYDNGGHTNPKWDAAVREAIVLNVRPQFDPNRSSRDDARMASAIERAAALGCDDPFFLYLRANRYRMGAAHDPNRAAQLMSEAAAGVLDGDYPAFRKLMAAARRAEAVWSTIPPQSDRRPTAEQKRAITRDVETALSLLPAAAAKDGAPRAYLYDAAATVYRANVRLLEDEDRAMAAVRQALEAATPRSGLSALFAAEVHLERVDAIRQNRDPLLMNGGIQDPDTKAAKEREQLGRARTALDAALALDPQDVPALIQMLRLLALSRAPRDEFEPWFERAMAAYPNNLRACQIKHAYLQQVGAANDCLAFGRECLAGGNWYSRIPLIVTDVHLSIARFDRPEEHFGRPDVWEDVRAAEEGYLKRFPNSVFDRSNLARMACFAGRWDVAKAQFDLLGDNAVYSVFRGKQTYDYLRRKAERLAKQGA